MLQIYQLDNSLEFPPCHLALDDPDGLLAFGGDLSPDRLTAAYQRGIFPWFSQGEPYLWWSPKHRGIIYLDNFHLSKSSKKTIRKYPFKVTLNKAFERVITECAMIPRTHHFVNESNTWITQEMIQAYIELHKQKKANSIEVWLGDELVGGLYGVTLGGVFCGESMFHTVTDASKIALSALVTHMKVHELGFIDCQMNTAHLASLGCKTVDRSDFLDLLKLHTSATPDNCWQAQELAILL